jgi:hypothetical protein
MRFWGTQLLTSSPPWLPSRIQGSLRGALAPVVTRSRPWAERESQPDHLLASGGPGTLHHLWGRACPPRRRVIRQLLPLHLRLPLPPRVGPQTPLLLRHLLAAWGPQTAVDHPAAGAWQDRRPYPHPRLALTPSPSWASPPSDPQRRGLHACVSPPRTVSWTVSWGCLGLGSGPT